MERNPMLENDRNNCLESNLSEWTFDFLKSLSDALSCSRPTKIAVIRIKNESLSKNNKYFLLLYWIFPSW